MISLLLTTMCFSVYFGLSCRGTIWMSFQSVFCEEDKASFHIQMELLESFVRQQWLAGVTWVMKLVRMLMLNKASQQQQRLSPGSGCASTLVGLKTHKIYGVLLSATWIIELRHGKGHSVITKALYFISVKQIAVFRWPFVMIYEMSRKSPCSEEAEVVAGEWRMIFDLKGFIKPLY